MADVATNEPFDAKSLQFLVCTTFSKQSAGRELSRMIALEFVCQNANPPS